MTRASVTPPAGQLARLPPGEIRLAALAGCKKHSLLTTSEPLTSRRSPVLFYEDQRGQGDPPSPSPEPEPEPEPEPPDWFSSCPPVLDEVRSRGNMFPETPTSPPPPPFIPHPGCSRRLAVSRSRRCQQDAFLNVAGLWARAPPRQLWPREICTRKLPTLSQARRSTSHP